MRKTFADEQAAKDHAATIAENLSQGKRSITDLGADDADIYFAALARIKVTNLTLLQVVDQFMRTWSADFKRARVKDVVAHYRKQVEEDPTTSAFYRADVKYRLVSFLKTFGSRWIDELTRAEIIDWIEKQKKQDGAPWGNRTRVNRFSLLRTIWYHARENKHLPAVANILESIPKHWRYIKAAHSLMAPEILAVLLRMLDGHKYRVQLLPYIALQAFGGIRVSEAKRLTWADITEENGQVVAIQVNRHQAKTRSRRTVPANPALASFLHEFKIRRQLTGSIVNLKKADLIIHRDFKTYSEVLALRHNELRHSCATYLLKFHTPEKVAQMLGTSTAMLASNYHELDATESVAKAWFAFRHTPKPEIEAELQRIEDNHRTVPLPFPFPQ